MGRGRKSKGCVNGWVNEWTDGWKWSDVVEEQEEWSVVLCKNTKLKDK